MLPVEIDAGAAAGDTSPLPPPQSDWSGGAVSSKGTGIFCDASSNAAADCADAAASMPKMETAAGALDADSVVSVAGDEGSMSASGDCCDSALPLIWTTMESVEDGASATSRSAAMAEAEAEASALKMENGAATTG